MSCPICDGPIAHTAVLVFECPKGHYTCIYSPGKAVFVVESTVFERNDRDSDEKQNQVDRGIEWALKAASISHQLSVLKGVAA